MHAPVLAHAEPRRLTRDEYDRMAELGFFRSERVELIRGIVVRMAPIGPPHANPVDVLNEWLVRGLAGRARVRIQQPHLACDESEPEPDVAVVPKGQYGKRHPDRAFLVIEVAETSLAHDRETKSPLYAASAVDEYWIVDVAQRAIEVRREPVDGHYTWLSRAAVGDSVGPVAFADLTIEVAALFL